MRSTLPFFQGPWGPVRLCSMPAASGQSLNSADWYPLPLSVITRLALR